MVEFWWPSVRNFLNPPVGSWMPSIRGVVRVLAAQDRRPRRAAERVGHEEVLESRAAVARAAPWSWACKRWLATSSSSLRMNTMFGRTPGSAASAGGEKSPSARLAASTDHRAAPTMRSEDIERSVVRSRMRSGAGRRRVAWTGRRRRHHRCSAAWRTLPSPSGRSSSSRHTAPVQRASSPSRADSAASERRVGVPTRFVSW